MGLTVTLRGGWSLSEEVAAICEPLARRITAAPRLVQYGIVGVVAGITTALIGVHNFGEGAVRPVRAALAGDTGIGDSFPRSRPTFAAWLGLSIFGSIFAFCAMAALGAVALDRGNDAPVLSVVVAGALAIALGLPVTVGAMLSPSFRPIRDLTEATVRVRDGDYSQYLPVSKTTTWVRSWRHSTGCRRVWLSGNDFKLHSVLTSTLSSRPACSSRATTCSPVSAAR